MGVRHAPLWTYFQFNDRIWVYLLLLPVWGQTGAAVWSMKAAIGMLSLVQRLISLMVPVINLQRTMVSSTFDRLLLAIMESGDIYIGYGGTNCCCDNFIGAWGS